MFDLRDLYQQVIVDHNKNPRNYGILAEANHHADGHNPLCGDQLHIDILTDDEGKIIDARFEGEGCAISVASASLMTEAMKGKSVAEFETLFDAFQHMVTADLDAMANEEVLGKLTVLAGVKEFPSRIKCAILCWHTSRTALADKKEVAVTE
ncbi:MAG: SUF system NifU family Fe-S cluster assembly protein [Zetaproteobacteria bacterium]|nr:SUF system NifU family Fe-S cluster assembly protein [Zetaproteobacteria bacterium]